LLDGPDGRAYPARLARWPGSVPACPLPATILAHAVGRQSTRRCLIRGDGTYFAQGISCVGKASIACLCHSVTHLPMWSTMPRTTSRMICASYPGFLLGTLPGRADVRRCGDLRTGLRALARLRGATAGLASACCCAAGLALALIPVSSAEALLAALFAPLVIILGGMAVHGPVAAVAGRTLAQPGRLLACLVQRQVEGAMRPVIVAACEPGLAGPMPQMPPAPDALPGFRLRRHPCPWFRHLLRPGQSWSHGLLGT
jgi:hypothetical protein